VSASAHTADVELLERLRKGDENAFASLLDLYHTAMVRIALIYVHEREIAEEVVQETWIAVLEGLTNFERRSSLKTWIFSILANQAKTRAQREGRYVSMAVLDDPDTYLDEPTVNAERFLPPDHQRWPHHWASVPHSWDELPEDHFLSQETFDIIRHTIEGLPANQRAVIALRDIEGWDTQELCNVLGVTETNQRVLLHRARAAVRRALEQYFEQSR
jgi:RNA polymerase sigma-70 factor (ECF subfamily)